jgi:hypothetical protein
MAERLCGNTSIQNSLNGKEYDKPCGFWGCNNEHYQDWLNTLKFRLDVAKRYYKQLEEISTFSGQSSLSDIEKYIGSQIALLKTEYDEFSSAGPDLASSDYKIKISALQQRISTAACLIQDLQEKIEDRGHTVTTSGLIATTHKSSWASTAALWLAIGIGGIALYRIVDRI